MGGWPGTGARAWYGGCGCSRPPPTGTGANGTRHAGRWPPRSPLLRFAEHDDGTVREAVVRLVTATGPFAVPLLPLLRARLDEEREPELRARLVTALGLLDVSDSARTARNTALLSAPNPPSAGRR
ncbi:hypothetical protein ACFQ60_16825 [Streptomyces zhihengii]